MYVCMYVCILALPLCSPVFPAKKTRFFQRFRKEDVQKHEFFQIFGKRMQEAQASKKAGRGNRAWDPCFATPRYVGDPPPKKKKTYVIDVGRGGVRGGVILYPLVSIRHAEQCRRIYIYIYICTYYIYTYITIYTSIRVIRLSVHMVESKVNGFGSLLILVGCLLSFGFPSAPRLVAPGRDRHA